VSLTGELLVALFIAYGYWIVFTAILLDNAGLPIPGELLLLAFGAVARKGHLDPVLGLAIAAVAALAGDSIGYWIGRHGAARVLRRRPRFSPGHVSLVFGRFVVGARMLLAPLAGATRMPFSRFLLCDAIGCLVWAGLFILVGYASGVSLDAMQQGLRVLSLAVQGAFVTVLATWGIARIIAVYRRRPA
jgi:membrane protein DedA with SNARE-associated domain